MELETKLEKNHVTLELDTAARELIADQGYDEKMGARPMARVIQEEIKRPLAEKLLFGELIGGGHVTVVVNAAGKLELHATPDTKRLEHLSPEQVH